MISNQTNEKSIKEIILIKRKSEVKAHLMHCLIKEYIDCYRITYFPNNKKIHNYYAFSIDWYRIRVFDSHKERN